MATTKQQLQRTLSKDAEDFVPDLASIVRADSGRILSALIAICGDMQLAEDAFQDACLQATQSWRQDSKPDNIRAWLTTVAKRRLIDKLRRSTRAKDVSVLRTIQASLNAQSEPEEDQLIPDERLKLIFTCCHPALKQEAQTALTLKTLCGLSVREIARAYLISEVAMNQRLVRAKLKIRTAGVAYKIPAETELEDRLEAVLTTIYLIYNESYSAFEGQTLTRSDLAEESIRLARILNQLLPRPNVAGLLSLMLLHQAREPARSSVEQPFIPLELQDRKCWDHEKISEGRGLLLTALGQGIPDKYQLQAAISALHCESTTWAGTDWHQISLLYKALYEINPSPIVKLNSLFAIAQLGNTEQALIELNTLQSVLEKYQPFHATKAEFCVRLGHTEQAKQSYQTAISITKNEAEREYLVTKLGHLG